MKYVCSLDRSRNSFVGPLSSVSIFFQFFFEQIFLRCHFPFISIRYYFLLNHWNSYTFSWKSKFEQFLRFFSLLMIKIRPHLMNYMAWVCNYVSTKNGSSIRARERTNSAKTIATQIIYKQIVWKKHNWDKLYQNKRNSIFIFFLVFFVNFARVKLRIMCFLNSRLVFGMPFLYFAFILLHVEVKMRVYYAERLISVKKREKMFCFFCGCVCLFDFSFFTHSIKICLPLSAFFLKHFWNHCKKRRKKVMK